MTLIIPEACRVLAAQGKWLVVLHELDEKVRVVAHGRLDLITVYSAREPVSALIYESFEEQDEEHDENEQGYGDDEAAYNAFESI